MSLHRPPSRQEPFFLPALLGACISIIVCIPLASFAARSLASTYDDRVLIYCTFLFWCILGALLLFKKTYRSPNQSVTLKKLALWCLSVWLWPLLLLASRNRQ